MNANTILSILRLSDFRHGIHNESQRSSQWPGLAVIPHVLPCGTANIMWALADYRVVMEGREAIPVKIEL